MGWIEVLDSMSNMGLHCNFGDRMKRAYMKLTAALCDMEPSVILPLQNVEELEETAKDVVRAEGETYGASAEVVTCYF